MSPSSSLPLRALSLSFTFIPAPQPPFSLLYCTRVSICETLLLPSISEVSWVENSVCITLLPTTCEHMEISKSCLLGMSSNPLTPDGSSGLVLHSFLSIFSVVFMRICLLFPESTLSDTGKNWWTRHYWDALMVAVPPSLALALDYWAGWLGVSRSVLWAPWILLGGSPFSN